MPRDLNEIQLQALRKEKSGLPKKLVQRLHELLYGLETSARFVFLGQMQVDQFLSGSLASVSGLKGLSFEQLVNLGAVDVCRISGMGKSRIEKLVTVLDQLLEGDETFAVPPKATQSAQKTRNVDFGPRPGKTSPLSDVPRYNSIEAARRIKDGLSAIKVLPDFSTLQSQKLHTVWDETIVRAPFIEDLTFRELCDLDVDILLKKKSFTDRKIYTLIKVLENTLNNHAPKEHQAAESPRTQSSALSQSVAPISIEWQGAEKLSNQYQHLLKLYAFEAAQVAGSAPRLGNALLAFSKGLSAVNFLIFLLTADNELESADKIAKQFSSEREEILQEVSREILPVIEKELGSEYSTWSMLLSAPAVSEDKLLSAAESFRGADGFVRSIARVCLLSMGATQPERNGIALAGHWTLNPESFAFTLTSFLETLPRSNADFERQLQALFPLVEQQDLQKFLKPYVTFDDSDKQWVVLDD